jgi:hypothetical protein
VELLLGLSLAPPLPEVAGHVGEYVHDQVAGHAEAARVQGGLGRELEEGQGAAHERASPKRCSLTPLKSIRWILGPGKQNLGVPEG